MSSCLLRSGGTQKQQATGSNALRLHGSYHVEASTALMEHCGEKTLGKQGDIAL